MRILKFVDFLFRYHCFDGFDFYLFLDFKLIELIFRKVSHGQLGSKVKSVPYFAVVVPITASAPTWIEDRLVSRLMLTIDFGGSHSLPFLLRFGDFIRKQGTKSNITGVSVFLNSYGLCDFNFLQVVGNGSGSQSARVNMHAEMFILFMRKIENLTLFAPLGYL